MWTSLSLYEVIVAAFIGGVFAALAGDFFRRLLDIGFALLAILGQACGGAMVAVGKACETARASTCRKK